MEDSLDDATLTCVAPERTQAPSVFLTCDLPVVSRYDLARESVVRRPVPKLEIDIGRGATRMDSVLEPPNCCERSTTVNYPGVLQGSNCRTSQPIKHIEMKVSSVQKTTSQWMLSVD